jgi:hypothetical protein
LRGGSGRGLGHVAEHEIIRSKKTGRALSDPAIENSFFGRSTFTLP